MKKRLISLIYNRCFHTTASKHWNVAKYPDLNFPYLCDPNKTEEIKENIERRKGVGDIESLQKLKQNLDSKDIALKNKFYEECKKIPNDTHPDIIEYGDRPKVVRTIGESKKFDFKPLEFHEIGKKLNLIRTEQLGHLSGHRSYYLLGDLAELERALVRYTLNKFIRKGFKLVTVPDILHKDVIEACGLNIRGERTQIFQLDEKHDSDLCLSGTSEMALAAYVANSNMPQTALPLKLVSVSRCFRAETSSIADERGIYRVHEFTKVELFVVSKPEDSNRILEEIRSHEEEHFADLGLHFRTLDMPPHELGAPAYRKYDIEAWMPGREMFGEVSSCSNCTDYQSRRLNIKYESDEGVKFAHTLNGTACAIPRMLIALLETYQNGNGTVTIPVKLGKFFRNKEFIGRQKRVPELTLVKYKK